MEIGANDTDVVARLRLAAVSVSQQEGLSMQSLLQGGPLPSALTRSLLGHGISRTPSAAQRSTRKRVSRKQRQVADKFNSHLGHKFIQQLPTVQPDAEYYVTLEAIRSSSFDGSFVLLWLMAVGTVVGGAMWAGADHHASKMQQRGGMHAEVRLGSAKTRRR